MVNVITRYYFVTKAKILVILYIQMPVLPRVEQLLTFTMFFVSQNVDGEREHSKFNVKGVVCY